MEMINQYNEDRKKLFSTLKAIIESNKYIMLVESTDQKNTLEYGIVGQKMESVNFGHLNGESLWEFVYKGICEIEPQSVLNFMMVKASENIHSAVVIDLNEKVKAIIDNHDHRYDDFISKLQTITENEKDVSTKQDPEEGPIIKKRIKPLS